MKHFPAPNKVCLPIRRLIQLIFIPVQLMLILVQPMFTLMQVILVHTYQHTDKLGLATRLHWDVGASVCVKRGPWYCMC